MTMVVAELEAVSAPFVSSGFAPFRPRTFTREEFYRMDELGFFENQRVERIDGEIIHMSPIGFRHSLAVGLTADALRAIVGKSFFVREQSPFPLPTSDLIPDVDVIPGTRRAQKNHPKQAVLIVEVADSSRTYDLGQKSQFYASSLTQEYWVVDLVKNVLVVFRKPEVDPASPYGFSFASRMVIPSNGSVTPLFAVKKTINVTDLLPS